MCWSCNIIEYGWSPYLTRFHHGLISAYLSDFIPYHTLYLIHSSVSFSSCSLSPWSLCTCCLPGPLYSNVMFCLTNPINPSDVLLAIPSLWSLPWPSKCKSMPFLCAPTALCTIFIWRVTMQYNGLCLIWILLQTMTLVYLGKEWFYLIHHYILT